MNRDSQVISVSARPSTMPVITEHPSQADQQYSIATGNQREIYDDLEVQRLK